MTSLHAQQLTLLDSVAIATPVAASIDKYNKVYIADNSGAVTQYSPEGKPLLTWSSPQPSRISLIEAWNPLRLFLFYEDYQQYGFLDRFLTPSQRYNIPTGANFTTLMTTSQDNNIWMVDLSEFSLKKYDTNFGQFTIQTPFDLVLDPKNYEITHIRAYQNFVFISDSQSGILVFDNLGNYLKTIPATGINHFSFEGNTISYISGQKLITTDLYMLQKKSLTLPYKALFAFTFSSKVILITTNRLLIYSRK